MNDPNVMPLETIATLIANENGEESILTDFDKALRRIAKALEAMVYIQDAHLAKNMGITYDKLTEK
jgi:hypothetical protein